MNCQTWPERWAAAWRSWSQSGAGRARSSHRPAGRRRRRTAGGGGGAGLSSFIVVKSI